MGKVVVLNDDLGYYEINKDLVAKADLIVYSYHDGGYDGQGFMVVKIGEDYYQRDLGHCSCYGPVDDLKEDNPGELINLNQFLQDANKTVFECRHEEAVRKYLKEILSNVN